MNIHNLLSIKYPEANFLHDIILQDDGQGAYIAQWNLLEPKPTQSDLDIWTNDPMIITAYTKQQNAIINKPIYDQLDALDLKSIRAIRSNDSIRIAELEAQAVALRAQLVV
jgi:hypothetical protein